MSHSSMTPHQASLYRERLESENRTLESTLPLPKNVFAVDQSGSISDADLAEAIRDFEEIAGGER